MSGFAIRHPHLVIVLCLIITVLGLTSLVRMPVDLFPPINIPVVTCATFYSGMPPGQVEAQITNTFERFFTLGSNIDHIESRSLPGVSLIKVYFTPGSDPNADVTQISGLAMADLRRLPHGTLPPVVLQTSASFLPVCLLAVKGKGLTETQLRDNLQYEIRDQIAGVPGATVPPPFGGKYRMEMVYVNPLKLQALGMSPMDVVNAVNQSNLILPAGDVRIGPQDYNIYTNAQVPSAKELNNIVLKTSGEKNVYVSDVGQAKDASFLQYNVVRIDGQRSVYVGVMKQGGNTNTIQVVDGIRKAIRHLRDIPSQMKAMVVFDQSQFVRQAIHTVMTEGGIGLLLTGLMILLFLGSLRATSAVFLSIPLSVLAAILMLNIGGSTIDAMLLSGLALAFSRLIDNSVIVLENIYRHMELGDTPEGASELGGAEVNLAVLAITLATIVVFFPVTLLYGVSKYLFMALASGVVLSLIASYFVAMGVVPLFCAYVLKPLHAEGSEETPETSKRSFGKRFHAGFNARFESMLNAYERWVEKILDYPRATVAGFVGIFALSLLLYPFLGFSFFPRTDAGQFLVNLQAPTGTRLELTEDYVKKVEHIVRDTVGSQDLKTIVSNVGVTSGFESLFTPNAAMHTAFVEVGLKADHKTSSFRYMDRVRREISDQIPELRTYFHSGSLVESVLNQGASAPIDVQVSGMDMREDMGLAHELAGKIRSLPNISDVYIPQDMDYPALMIDVNRTRVSELGLTPRDVIDNVITALTSNQMIAPDYWIDPKSGNQYLVSVKYPDNAVHSLADLETMPLHDPRLKVPTYLNQLCTIRQILTPTEVDHYQLERTIDIYVKPQGEDLSRPYRAIQDIIASTPLPSSNLRVDIRGLILTMEASFKSFAIGLTLAVLLVFLILVAQTRSFMDPFLILLAIPTGLTGVLLILVLTGTTVNIQSLTGVLMMVGMVVSNTILIVDFAKRLQQEGKSVREAVVISCRIRLRPILMTSLATIVGLLPMAFQLEAGSAAYSPLARAIIGGLSVSVVLSIFLIPAAYLLAYRNRETGAEEGVRPQAQ
ncbi:MAG: efflux RND transporter permease subunit [Acidobacteriia bacterium]|nr:efflux RND transporter permease subunit [Terriglobia bacterium]